MEPRSLQYLASVCGGELLGTSPVAEAARIVTDSRAVQAGDLFVAIRGERFDGHDFLAEVAARGPLAVLVARDQRHKLPAGLPAILVDDPRAAYGAISAAYRREFSLPVACVGGSNGKTTTKELIAAAVSPARRTLKSEASFNNDVGVPATLLRLDSSHEVAVLEAGTNHPGELAPLVRMIAPKLGVITSIGREHLEYFGDLAGVVREEGWLAELLPSADRGGVLFLDGDGPFAAGLAARTAARVVRVGWKPANDWHAEMRVMDWHGTTFAVRAPVPEWGGEFRIALPGRHSVPNALLALAVACELGVEPAAARDGLAKFSPAKQRLATRHAAGVWLLDDTYNANADSMIAALRTLTDLPCSGRRVAVLGDMAELGPQAGTAHAEVGRVAAELGVDLVFTVGGNARVTAEAAGQARGRACASLDGVAAAVVHLVQPGDCVLVKASRSARLERVVEVLVRQLEMRARARGLGETEFLKPGVTAPLAC